MIVYSLVITRAEASNVSRYSVLMDNFCRMVYYRVRQPKLEPN